MINVNENRLIHGDCLEVMKHIPDESINLVLTSPPYKADKEYEEWKSLNDYKKFVEEWTKLAIKILANNGSLWINLGYTKTGKNTTLPLSYLYFPIINISFIQEIVWHYEGGMSYKKRFTHRTERWMWFSKDTDNMTFNLDDVRDLSLNRTKDKRNHPLGKNPTDYWYFDRVVSGTGKVKEKTKHPCQFPEKMIERIILACSNKNDIVLDPFIGSGTTAKVALDLNRRFIGIEKEKKYYDIAKERIDKWYNDNVTRN